MSQQQPNLPFCV
jgi:hypothetical protein